MYLDDDDDQIPNSYSQRVAPPMSQQTAADLELDQELNDVKPKIILFGLRRSGKTSIRKVVFHKMSANETIFLESTTKLESEDVSRNCFIDYVIYDFPGQADALEDNAIDYSHMFYGKCALIFVVDVLEDYKEALDKLVLQLVQLDNKDMLGNIEVFVFIHKVDGLSDDQRAEALKDINFRVNDDLAEAGISINLKTQLTSVYDYSIFEALSIVGQKLIPELLSTFESLLNALKEPCGMDRVLLFDVATKCYIATDTETVPTNKYEICCDMLDLVADVSNIYTKPENYSFYDSKSFSSVHLDNGTVILTKYICNNLTLVCLLQESCLSELGLIEHNIAQFSDGMGKVLQAQTSRKLINT